MSGPRTYGISTHLFHGQRLGRDHLREIAAARFTAIELVATRTHLDYHSDAVVADLQQWLAESALTLARVHAPVSERYSAGRHVAPLTLAASDADVRARALAETERALHIARRIPFEVFVVHIGTPRGHGPDQTHRSSRDGARRSLEALHRVAAPLGVKLAVEVARTDLAEPGPLVHFLEEVVGIADIGVCLDFGHGHLTGDLVDAIETVAEHLLAVDLHDNRGRTDDHLVPFEGTIDWPAALTTLQKVGYDGALMFEVPARGNAAGTLKQAQQARQIMDRLFAD